MRLVLMGPPGSGKGTQAERLCADYAIAHISSGDILRAEVARKSDFGLQIKEFMDRGEIGPQELITEVVLDYIGRNCPEAFVADGFPRTAYQARKLDESFPADRAVLLDVPDGAIVKRITGRRICRDCKTIYHVESRPPRRDGICDACGGALVRRDDDNEATIVRRLEVYRNDTMPVIDYYRDRGILTVIDGTDEPDDVYREIARIARNAGT